MLYVLLCNFFVLYIFLSTALLAFAYIIFPAQRTTTGWTIPLLSGEYVMRGILENYKIADSHF